MRIRSKVMVALFAMLPVTACASIPERSDPTPVETIPEGDASSPVLPPPKDLDSFGLVRHFVDTAAAPERNHRTARLHLEKSVRDNWRVPSELLIVDNVDTVPGRPLPEAPEDVQMVRLEADKVGRLKPDQSFVPEAGEYTVELKVHRGQNDEWRLVDPPPALIVSRDSFEQRYMPVRVFFLDQQYSRVVPDRRYVVSQPASNLPRRVIDLLMMGPSEGFRSSMATAIPNDAYSKTNPSEAADGALVVNLGNLKRSSVETRRLIAAQVVLSLQDVSSARVRLLDEDSPMLPAGKDLRPSDVERYVSDSGVRPDLPGLGIVDERVRVLDDAAEPVPGPAGSGELNVVRAGQSADGSRLAVVARTRGGVGLRVGDYGGQLPEVGVYGADMLAPTWRSESELWTVVDDHEVVRVIDSGDGWMRRPVDTSSLPRGKPIQYLRLSHDGTRVAAIVGGRAIVAGVHEVDGVVKLERPVVLSGGPKDANLRAIEWLTNGSLVATTDSSSAPVVEVSVDGYSWKSYESSNLVQPLSALAVTPNHQVVVVDGNGLWRAGGQNDLWSFVRVPISTGWIPFYPG